MDLCIHRCRNVRVDAHCRSNSNFISLQLVHERGTLDIALYDLPQDVTDALLGTFGDPETRDYDQLYRRDVFGGGDAAQAADAFNPVASPARL